MVVIEAHTHWQNRDLRGDIALFGRVEQRQRILFLPAVGAKHGVRDRPSHITELREHRQIR